jgi:hypothetical protein
MPTLANGQIVVAPPKMYEGPSPAKLPGNSMLDAAAKQTLESQHDAAQAFAKMGAGQKGGGSYAYVPKIPEGGTVPGVSHEKAYVGAIDIYNQARANAAYDKLIHAPPIQVKTGGKRKLKTKKKHGRGRNRTHRRKHRRNTRRRRRGSRAVV